MSDTTIELEAAPTRTVVTEYSAVVLYGPSVVLDETFEHPSARRSAVVELLLANHDELAHQDINEILAPFGGANADEALRQVLEQYASHGVDVDVNLGERQRDLGPAVIYTTFTDYGDGTTTTVHVGSREQRLTDLRERASHLSVHEESFFEDADEATCVDIIETALKPTRGRLLLMEAERRGSTDVWIGYVSPEE